MMIILLNFSSHLSFFFFNIYFETNIEDTLNHLQHIRESVVQMKNSSSSHNQYYTASGLIKPAVSNFIHNERFSISQASAHTHSKHFPYAKMKRDRRSTTGN